ncbi:hypothetical protein RAA17_22540 [Komagataeibacter rhaeticus]|nr:hypothetical protein [Komagataeibacter rhaeticus]
MWNACVANKAARRLFLGWLDSEERNLLRYVFLDPAARTFPDDWEAYSPTVSCRIPGCQHPWRYASGGNTRAGASIPKPGF